MLAKEAGWEWEGNWGHLGMEVDTGQEIGVGTWYTPETQSQVTL